MAANVPGSWEDPSIGTETETHQALRAREQDVQNSRSQPPIEVAPHDNEETEGDGFEKSATSSMPDWAPEPGFEHVDGDIGGSGMNETKVDIIAVPCIGASPVETWIRDPLPIDGYFGVSTQNPVGETAKRVADGIILNPAIHRHLPKAQHLWIRQGIKKEVNIARIMLYRHRELSEGLILDRMAEDLLDQICRMREGTKPRPLFFICHSIGGLVAKLALVKASKRQYLHWIISDCHGMTFFATPHRGSSYLSMPNLRENIQQLLYLSKPLPKSISGELRINNKPLLEMHDVFTDIAIEMHIWTFYETVETSLSGWEGAKFDEVHFSAPLASIKSGLVGSRHEQTFSLESDHAHCASFGPNNIRMMHSYLADLGNAVRKADQLSSRWKHTPLRLADSVKIELVGFYDDPDPETPSIRLYVSQHHLNEFLEKGPEQCLHERLNTVAPKSLRGGLSPPSGGELENLRSGALDIWDNVQDFFGGSRGKPSSYEKEGRPKSPDIVVTSHAPRPPVDGAASQSIPAAMPRRRLGLTVPSLSTPGFHRPSCRSSSQGGDRSDTEETAGTLSEPVATDISPLTVDPVTIQSATRNASPDSPEIGLDPAKKARKERANRASVLQDFTAGFSRPDPSRRKFMWIHLPFNNPHWVNSIFNKLSETQNQSYLRLLKNDYWVNRHVHGRYSQAHASYVRPGCGFVKADAVSPQPPSPSLSALITPAQSPNYFFMYLPYLHFDTYLNIVKRRKLVKRRLKHGRTRPVPTDVADLDSPELRVIWEYIGHDPPLNMRRTLDQYGYPSLRDTSARDDDQMLYKLTKERVAIPPTKRDLYGSHPEKGQSSASSDSYKSPASRLESFAEMLVRNGIISASETDSENDLEDDILDGNVLMVDQLWLWAVDTTTLTTFFPKRESHPTEGPMFQQADLRNSVYNELNGDLTSSCENALDLAAFVTLHAVTVLLDRTSHPDLEIFRIFEEALGVLTERMTSSLKRFRMQTFKGNIIDPDSEDELEKKSSESIKKRHKRELEQAERANREHTSAVLELRDMDDELNTMKNLFQEQERTIVEMKNCYEKPELKDHTQNGRMYLQEALERLEDYQKQTAEIMYRIETTRKDYEKLLELIQRQAQVDEVRWSRLQTELASTQNLSVMIFTTFTVIFLPLSFFTSLFGMNTKEWGGPAENNFPSLKLIGAISLPGSAFLIMASLVAAFSSRVQNVFKTVYKHSKAGVDHVKHRFSKLQTKKGKEIKERRRRMRAEMHAQAMRRKERGYDFWEQVRLESKDEYQIPELNRKASSRRRLTGRGTWR